MSYKTKQEVLQIIQNEVTSLKKIRKLLKDVKGKHTSKSDIQELGKNTVTIWFDDVKPALTNFELDEQIITKCTSYFERLLRLSSANSRISSYNECLDDLISILTKEVIIEVTKLGIKIKQLYQLENILENVNPKELEYLREAVECAHNHHYRASVVLGWSAAIWRFQKTIEKLGFEEFNKKSEEMKKITSGRYKWFKKSVNVTNMAELQTVFDSQLLWILEYWGLIDSNQHDRLEICFTMRNNSAHPGEAPISPENLLSFYSDLKNMVFDNPKFQVI